MQIARESKERRRKRANEMKNAHAAPALLAALFLLATGAAQASSVTACLREMHTHCGQAAGASAIEACVNTHLGRFSSGCRAMASRSKPALRTCRADLDRVCGQRGATRLGLCARVNSRSFTASCRAAFSRATAPR
jgi:hypothetical protein